jgi:hypothetical protein
VETWSKGGLDSLLVPRAVSDLAPAAIRGQVTLVPR